MTTAISESVLEARARRAARRIGLVATKTRWRRDSPDNQGGFMILDPSTRSPVFGDRWDLSAEAVIEYCASAD